MDRSDYNNSVKLYSSRLHQFIKKLTGDEEQTKDFVQDCYMKLWIHNKQVKTDKVRAWLFQTAYREVLMDRRKQSYHNTYIETLKEETTDNTYNGAREALNTLIESLPASYKAVLLLKDEEGYSYEEIAQQTQMTIEQVKITLYRAIVKMKQMIGKKENII